ncbi:hypothetical protein [Priestia flexa]|uniref:hypothetical protein n=1 Tax=Priestia flexa TaxID=86664 RepID=UPI001B326018|nr:hypothetical protein [Priestia flexa]
MSIDVKDRNKHTKKVGENQKVVESAKEALLIQKLVREKEELEREFTEILEFMLADMKKQDELFRIEHPELLIEDNEEGLYKDKYEQAIKDMKLLENGQKESRELVLLLKKNVQDLENEKKTLQRREFVSNQDLETLKSKQSDLLQKLATLELNHVESVQYKEQIQVKYKSVQSQLEASEEELKQEEQKRKILEAENARLKEEKEQLSKQYEELKVYSEKTEERMLKLENSKLGRMTIAYWSFRKKLSRK